MRRARDRRTHRRYGLSAQVRFTWELAGGTVFPATGISRDLSAKGLFVMAEHLPPVGSAVRFVVDLSTVSWPAVKVRAKGQVTRVERPDFEGRVGGCAILTRRMTFEKLESSPG